MKRAGAAKPVSFWLSLRTSVLGPSPAGRGGLHQPLQIRANLSANLSALVTAGKRGAGPPGGRGGEGVGRAVLVSREHAAVGTVGLAGIAGVVSGTRSGRVTTVVVTGGAGCVSALQRFRPS
jgi:hypothetical protein